MKTKSTSTHYVFLQVVGTLFFSFGSWINSRYRPCLTTSQQRRVVGSFIHLLVQGYCPHEDIQGRIVKCSSASDTLVVKACSPYGSTAVVYAVYVQHPAISRASGHATFSWPRPQCHLKAHCTSDSYSVLSSRSLHHVGDQANPLQLDNNSSQASACGGLRMV